MRHSILPSESRLLYRDLVRPGAPGLAGGGYILDKKPQQEVRNRTLSLYALVYLLEGGGYYRDARGERRVREGDCLVLFPGLRHSYYRGDSPRWSEAFLMFSGGLFNALEADRLLDRSQPVLTPGFHPTWVDALYRLIGDFMGRRLDDGMLAAARVHLLLAELAAARSAAAVALDPGGSFSRRACAILEEDLAAPLDLRSVARTFNLSYERFRKRFAADVGVPPGRYRVLRRIDRAKALLAEGRLPIKALADCLGYCDLYFFCRQFKRETGQTPGTFRRLV